MCNLITALKHKHGRNLITGTLQRWALPCGTGLCTLAGAKAVQGQLFIDRVAAAYYSILLRPTSQQEMEWPPTMC